MNRMISSKRPRRYLLYASQDYSFPILKPIQQALAKRCDQVAWFVHGNANAKQYLQPSDPLYNSVAGVMAYEPFAIITPNNTVPHFFPGIKCQVFHGFNARKRSRGGLDSHFAIRGFFDLYCTQGPSTTKVFQQLSARHKHFKVVETGWPKMDALGQLPAYQNPNKRPIILLTSTFSKRLSCALHLLPVIKQLVANNDMDWMVQFHPKMAPEIVAQYTAIQADNYQFVETSDVMPFLLKADVMVSDTSSILQEFLQLRRPVVTFRNRTPGPWLIDIQEPDELREAINTALSRPQALIEEIQQHNAELHPYTDGRSSERVLHAIENFANDEKNSLRSKPLNLMRKFKLRKEMGYWKP